MRVIATIPHPRISISIFSMNDKYLIKFEAGPMEQLFKIQHQDIDGIEGIKKMIDDEFLKTILERFNEMFVSFQAAQKRMN